MPDPTLAEITVGAVVARQMGHGGPVMMLTVTEVTDDLIHCGDWTFDRETGAEIDEVMGWNKYQTGSFITLAH